MSLVGRKLYLDWGDCIIAIEKYPATEENRDELGLSGREKMRLSEIVSVLGTRIERPLTLPEFCRRENPLKHELTDYIIKPEYWITKDEIDIYEEYELKSRRKDLSLKKSYSLEKGRSVEDALYKIILKEGVPIRVLSKDREESFWGYIFNDSDLSIYKSCEERPFLFMAANDTICGCLSGTVYRAENIGTDVVLCES